MGKKLTDFISNYVEAILMGGIDSKLIGGGTLSSEEYLNLEATSLGESNEEEYSLISEKYEREILGE